MTELVGSEAIVINPTRGTAGPGEVDVPFLGVFIAYSDEPLPKGTSVVVYEELGSRKVRVQPIS